LATIVPTLRPVANRTPKLPATSSLISAGTVTTQPEIAAFERQYISNGWERSGNVWGMAFGIFLLLLGLAIASGVNVWQSIGAIIMIGTGAAILAGALVGLRRRDRE